MKYKLAGTDKFITKDEWDEIINNELGEALEYQEFSQLAVDENGKEVRSAFDIKTTIEDA